MNRPLNGKEEISRGFTEDESLSETTWTDFDTTSPKDSFRCSIDDYLKRKELELEEKSHKDDLPTEEELAQRKVRFHEELEKVHEVDPISDEDRANYWLDDRDLDRFETELLTILKNHRKGKIKSNDPEITFRGLEHRGEDRLTVECTRLSHLRSVLDEVRRQKKAGAEKLDWKRISKAARPYSSLSTQRALDFARQDEQETQRILAEDALKKNKSAGRKGTARPVFVQKQTKEKESSPKKSKKGFGLLFRAWKEKKNCIA
jgi:hypothetical protein